MRSPVVIMTLLVSTSASAGPPYATDDPEPVAHRQWELYLASQSFRDKTGWTGTAPHIEVNYGAVPNVQLHVITPLAYSIQDNGGRAYGFGDAGLSPGLVSEELRALTDLRRSRSLDRSRGAQSTLVVLRLATAATHLHVVSVGAEVFHLTPKGYGGEDRGLEGSNLFQGYVAYLVTFGPKNVGN